MARRISASAPASGANPMVSKKARRPTDSHDKDIVSQQWVQSQEVHCPDCGRFIGWAAIVWGSFKVKCTNSKCAKWLTFNISPENKDRVERY